MPNNAHMLDHHAHMYMECNWGTILFILDYITLYLHYLSQYLQQLFLFVLNFVQVRSNCHCVHITKPVHYFHDFCHNNTRHMLVMRVMMMMFMLMLMQEE